MDCIYISDHQYGVSMMMNPSPSSSTSTSPSPSPSPSVDGDQCVQRKRKREKLDHLSEEEKLLRRKIKNRQSAQTSRDKKKRVMSTMEIELASMSEANKSLIAENFDLKKRLNTSESNELRISTLEMENKLLKEKLDLLEKMILSNQKLSSSTSISDNHSIESDSEKSMDASFEPAVPINGSQQKNQEVNKEILMIWTMLLIISLIVMVKILFHGYHLSPINYWKTKLNHHHHFYSVLNKIKIYHKQLDHYK